MSEYIGSDSSDDGDSSLNGETRTSDHSVNAARAEAAFVIGKSNENRAAEPFWAKNEAKQSFLADVLGEQANIASIEADKAKLETHEVDDDDDSEEESDAGEEAAPLNELSDSEKRVAVLDYIEEREIAIDHESAEADTPDATAATAAAEMMLQRVNEELISDPEANVDDVLETAAEPTESEVEAAVAAAGVEASQEADADDEEDDATTASSGTNGGGTNPPISTPPPVPPTPNSPPPPPITPPTPPFVPPGPPGPPIVPPGPPGLPPTPGLPPSPFNPNGQPGPNTISNFNSYTAPATALTQEDIDKARRHGETSGLVIGGILGYLIGRRRGRIKTERRLLPIQKNLENQVKGLHEVVDDKEREVRNLAADKINLLDEAQRQPVAEQLRAQAASRTAENRPAAAKFSQELRRLIPEDRPDRQSVERPLGRPELVAPAFQNTEAAPPQQHIESVERMSRREMLDISDKVIIAGSRLRDIFESNLITELGLRHILTEFLSGGDIKKALDQELDVKQLAYERDPKLRDQMSAGYGTNRSATGAAAVSAAGVSGTGPVGQNPQSNQASGGVPTPPAASKDAPSNGKSDAAIKREQMMVGSWMVAIAILLIIVFILISRRS